MWKWFALALTLAPVALAEGPETAPPAVEIVVESGRYVPAEVKVPAGEPARLQFVRKEWNSCTREVVFPTLDIRRELPPEQPVIIELPALPAGEVPFHCGMGMVHGKVVVEAR